MPQIELRAEKIELIRKFPAQLEATVSNLSDAELDLSFEEGEWTPRQVLHHLADAHLNAFIRMKLILTEDHPTLKPYDQDAWAKLVDTTLPLEPSLLILRGVHTRWCVMMEAVPEESWARTAYHPENGIMSLDDLLNLYSNHCVEHLEQIARLKKA